MNAPIYARNMITLSPQEKNVSVATSQMQSRRKQPKPQINVLSTVPIMNTSHKARLIVFLVSIILESGTKCIVWPLPQQCVDIENMHLLGPPYSLDRKSEPDTHLESHAVKDTVN